MAEVEKGYQKLIELYEAGEYGDLGFIINALKILADQGVNVESIMIPMLVELAPNSIVELGDYAEVSSVIGTIFNLRATPSQLVQILQLPEFMRMEASKPYYTSDGMRIR